MLNRLLFEGLAIPRIVFRMFRFVRFRRYFFLECAVWAVVLGLLGFVRLSNRFPLQGLAVFPIVRGLLCAVRLFYDFLCDGLAVSAEAPGVERPIFIFY